MTTQTVTFPVSLGERVYSNRLRKAGTVVALSVAEGGAPKARIEYLNRDDAPQLAWMLCSTLSEPGRPTAQNAPHGHPNPHSGPHSGPVQKEPAP
ncbi:hypothetical protein SAMN04515647_4429 [Cohaesibacter sp. ES.047]|uniref:hypothetical protein n=1 Tax=Cohaesibacter sp. ES.047 TaxID=1798205 RepID=UPI000BBFE5C4|nr:hypothetical protein [Cohaesibacter sp. ES.047]SNY94106.1 hypothetical protein SAMN04515647_4429 [Cohaesibacter sp. ES.047]